MEQWRKIPKVISGDYENIFGLIAEIREQEVKFLLSEAEIKPNASILDLCCGTGRHSIELAKAGYTVTGLDISVGFLEVAQLKAKNEEAKINFIRGDMRNIPNKDGFDLIFIMFGAWAYFEEDEQNPAVLFQVYEALQTGRHFILDFFNHDWIVKNFQPHYWSKTGDDFLLEKGQSDLIKGRHNSISTFIKPDGNIIEWETSVRGYTLAEIISMLEKAKFKVRDIFGGIDRKPFCLDTSRLLIHAEK